MLKRDRHYLGVGSNISVLQDKFLSQLRALTVHYCGKSCDDFV